MNGMTKISIIAILMSVLVAGTVFAANASAEEDAADVISSITWEDSGVVVKENDKVMNSPFTPAGEYGLIIEGEGSVAICDVNITNSNGAAITIIGNIILVLNGDNTLTGNNNCAGIAVYGDNKLTIEGDGSLVVLGGVDAACIGGNNIDGERNSGLIVINGGSIKADVEHNSGGAVIGGALNGNGYVEINGGLLNITTDLWYKGGAAIGSGRFDIDQKVIPYVEDDFTEPTYVVDAKYTIDGVVMCGFNGYVKINGGSVDVTGIIGAGYGNNAMILITGGTVNVNGCIGNNYGTYNEATIDKINRFMNIVLISSDVDRYTSVDVVGTNGWNSPIGGGMNTDAYIEITGSNTTVTVVAQCLEKYYQGAPGIGGGYYGIGQVTIEDAKVVAVGGNSSPGIGNGVGTNRVKDAMNNQYDVESAKLSHILGSSYVHIIGSSDVKSTGGVYAPGIGGSRGSYRVEVVIAGESTVIALAGGHSSADEETTFGAAGIGSAYRGPFELKNTMYDCDTNLTISISEYANVTAIGGNNAPAIGAGYGNIPGLVIIADSASIFARSGLNADHIIDGSNFIADSITYIANEESIALTEGQIADLLANGLSINIPYTATEIIAVNERIQGKITMDDGATYIMYISTPINAMVKDSVAVADVVTSFSVSLENVVTNTTVQLAFNIEAEPEPEPVPTPIPTPTPIPVPEPTYYNVIFNGPNAVLSGNMTVLENTAYTGSISATDGYVLMFVTVTMNGADITESSYSDGIVTIGNVTGDVEITVTVTEPIADDISSPVNGIIWWIVPLLLMLFFILLLSLEKRKKDDEDDVLN